MPPKRCSELPLVYSVYREKSVMNRERHLWYLSLTTPKCKSMTFCSFSFQASPWLVAPAPPSKATRVLCPPSKSYAKIYRQKRYALSTHLFRRKIMKDFQPSNALLQNALQHRCVITLDLLSQQFGVGHVGGGRPSEIIFSEKHDLQKLSSLLCFQTQRNKTLCNTTQGTQPAQRAWSWNAVELALDLGRASMWAHQICDAVMDAIS